MLAMSATLAVLAGCASHAPGSGQNGMSASTDQTDSQRRARIRLQLAVGYYQQHQNEIALNEIRRALEADPSLADAYSMRGLIYMNMGENRLAEEDLLKALKLQPNNPDFSNNYGWLLCQTGRERDAIGYFEAAFKNRNYDSPSKALNNAGVCSLKIKDKSAAQRYFLQAFQHDPSSPATSAHLARLYYDQRDYQRAQFYASRAVKSETAGPDVLWLAIRIERKLGNRSAEASLAGQLRRRYPASPEYAAFERGVFDE
jgi:type IV pilus assembly protein PilF